MRVTGTLLRFIPCVFFVGIAISILSPVAISADPVPLDSFFGRFEGAGIHADENSKADGVTPRDMTVEIGAEGSGFFVAWSTVIKPIGEEEPRRRQHRVVFEPSGRANLYFEIDSAPAESGRLRWAEIVGDTMTVNVLTIEDGRFVLQIYHRTLTSEGLALIFQRITNGLLDRLVSGTLVRSGS